ncbi:hypothetical protein [Cohnella sp.]|uniref:hypothetical protein n=1 Tax=Cohnella sp. TaxID=1883426 RepID=UPI0035681EF3
MEEQKRQASGMRLEMLNKQGEGEKKLLVDIVLPVLRSTKGLILEYEIVTLSGVKAYIDAFYEPLEIGFEGEGFVAHAQNITRSRFDFERNKVRSMSVNDLKYFPFTWDEMDKKTEFCRRAIYEVLGRHTSGGWSGVTYSEVSLYEREVIRYALRLNRPIRMADVCECLQSSHQFCRSILRKMIEKNLLKPLRVNAVRHHEYVLVDGVSKYLW